MPSYHGNLGHYRIDSETGLIAATLAANGTLFSFRWTDSTKLCVLRDIEISCVISGAITAAVHFGLDAFIARSFSASDSGGAALTLTGNNQKKLTSMGTSLVGDARIATTATLTPGTRTLDANPFAGVLFGTGTAIGSTALPKTKLYGADEYPIIFAQNEGFVIRNPFAGPITGSFVVGVEVAWEELQGIQFL